MFTSDDFISYFSEIETSERMMRDIYGAALEEISDPALRDEIAALMADEVRHEYLIRDLKLMVISKSLHE